MKNVLLLFAVIVVSSLFANSPADPIDAAGVDAVQAPQLVLYRPSESECSNGTCSIVRRYESVRDTPASYSSVSREVVRSGDCCDRPLMNAGRAVLRRIRHPFGGRFARR